MYYYGARYFDPKISLFLSVDQKSEEFPGWMPYHYVHQNPLNLVDPTGMAAEDPTDPPGGKKEKGDKVLHVKYNGEDKSIYENDRGIIAGIYRGVKILNKNLRKQSDKLLSGGFHFFDDDAGAKGDMTLKKRPMEGQKVETINAAGFMQGGSFAKGGEGFGKAKEVQGSFGAFNNVMSGLDLGQKIPESKVTIDISTTVWEIKPGDSRPSITKRIQKDTTVQLKNAIQVRFNNSQKDAANYLEASRKFFGPR